MWEIEAVNYMESTKPYPVAYFLEEKDADDYIEYLATVDVVATKQPVTEFHYVGEGV